MRFKNRIINRKSYLKKIKEKFIEELILRIYQLRLLIKIEIDLFNFALGVCLIQKYKNKVWYLVAYYSYKIILLELNYDIYNKELLAIVTVLKEQRAFLQGTIDPFIIKIDYKNLMEFLTTKELNYRQVRWAEILAEYYFKIKYIKGTDNAKVDTLNRKAKL